jgi:hypothetical protein
MTFDNYIDIMNRRPYGPLGPLGGVIVCRVEAPRRPIATARPMPPPRPSVRPVPAVRPVPVKITEPRYICFVCHAPSHLVPGTLRCEGCHTEILARVRLAQQGLRVVP